MAFRARAGPLLTLLLLAVAVWLQGCGDSEPTPTVGTASTGTTDETMPPTPPPPPTGPTATLTSNVSAGSTELLVDSTEGFNLGDTVLLESDESNPVTTETAIIASFGSIVLTNGVAQSYPAGATVTQLTAGSAVSVTSTGLTKSSPHCSWFDHCTWDATTQAECAMGLCRAQGYAFGIFVEASNDPCVSSFENISHWSYRYDLKLTELNNPGSDAQITATCDGDATDEGDYENATDEEDRLLTDEKWLATGGLPQARGPPGAGAALGAAAALGLAAVALGRWRAARAPEAGEVGGEQSDVLIHSADC